MIDNEYDEDTCFVRPIKSIKTKLIIRIILAFVLLSIVVQGIVFYSFRDLTVLAAQEKALSIAELIRDAITSLMILGVVKDQNVFLDRIQFTHGLKSVRIIRGDLVNKQYGEAGVGSSVKNSLEYDVLKTGQIRRDLRESLINVEYELVIPYKATSEGKVNCMACHQAKEGEVLGAVDIIMDLSSERKRGFSTLSYMIMVSLLFSLATLYMIYVFFKPYTELFQKLKAGFSKAEDGDFGDRVEVKLRDEAGDVATGYNTMVGNLYRTLLDINRKVSFLIGYQLSKSGNAIKDTVKTVDVLVKIYNFKRTIEKDTRKMDIYLRVNKILDDMGIKSYSLYEVVPHKNMLTLISSSIQEGSCGQEDRTSGHEEGLVWCNEVIVNNADECRAKRTGGIVDCREFPRVCPNFAYAPQDRESTCFHYCIPIYIGGQVGLIVQIVYRKEEEGHILDTMPYLKSFLKEGEPVLEAKTFMELLREQSLVDQLTGLYNRRFLDEISAKLSAQTKRRGTIIGILMIDIDFFKQVNDTYGHDVGDKVLKRMAAIIKGSVRDSDIAIRYGGEEIIVLLVDVVAGASKDIAEKIRLKIQDETIEIPEGALKKTVSIGVSEFPAHGDKFWQCVKFADTVLYKAKEDGRNRVYVFKPEMWDKKEY